MLKTDCLESGETLCRNILKVKEDEIKTSMPS